VISASWPGAAATPSPIPRSSVIADTETGLGGERLTGEVARATGQLGLFAVVLRDGGCADAVISPAAG
jgi:hypothetical protein